MESLLEDARIKPSGCVADLLGVRRRRMLQALARGETDAARLADMAHVECMLLQNNYKTPCMLPLC
jgi:hypothetical protein